MRKNIVILTVAVLCIMLTSCSKNNAESKMDNQTDQNIENKIDNPEVLALTLQTVATVR